METITINDRTLEFSVGCEFIGYGVYFYTDFFEGEETIEELEYDSEFPKFWKRKLVGKKLITKPKFLFRVHADIKDTKILKNWWRNKITKELEILGRKDEIKRGEYI